MADKALIKGFSRLTRDEKVKWLSDLLQDEDTASFLARFRLNDTTQQERFESFSENTLSNYHLPWGLVPNVMIDGVLYHVPLVIEESSVVAAASKASSFWAARGGFITQSISTIKIGQLHFFYEGDKDAFHQSWISICEKLLLSAEPLTDNMRKRGGGIVGLKFLQVEGMPSNYYQLELKAETKDSMGANFINSVLEHFGKALPKIISDAVGVSQTEVLMAILSNHTPGCTVKMQVHCPVEQLTWNKEMEPARFAKRMKLAADLAWHDIARAVTHNKGIYNGVDAVVLATGNDFRAVEAAGHAFAAKDGRYRSLSRVNLTEKEFALELEIPLALGTVGGLTKLHPLAAKSLQILGNPDAATLMKISAALGLANNFSAMASLVTTGIQQGHMKMHLQNILHSLDVDKALWPLVDKHFEGLTISVSAVREYVSQLQPRNPQN